MIFFFRYVFPLYKISYLWYSVFGALCTFVLGVIISYFTGPTDLTKLDQMYISPPLRKYLPRKPAYEKGTEDLPESVKMLDKKVCVNCKTSLLKKFLKIFSKLNNEFKMND